MSPEEKAVTNPGEEERYRGGHLERSNDQHRAQPACGALPGRAPGNVHSTPISVFH